MRQKLLGYAGWFSCGAAVATGSCLAALRRYPPGSGDHRDPDTVPAVQEDIGRFGFPVAGAEVRHYANHALSYDQTRRTPRWVAEHLTDIKLLGSAERKHCKFRPDPGIPEAFTARNEDYLGSGWSRGHMAPAGDNKSSEQSMAETFYLSNIVPQNYENNAGFWNRLEMYCRELTKRFADVWIISGPLTLPEAGPDGKKMMSYQVLGKDDVAVPTHLFKVILVGNKKNDANNNSTTNNNNNTDQSVAGPAVALGAFVVPNQPIGFNRPLTDFQVGLSELERLSGLQFFPALAGAPSLPSLCEADSCHLLDYKEFTLYLTGRKVGSARSSARLDKLMDELKEQGIAPDEYLLRLYQRKKTELASRENAEGKTGS